MKINNIKYLYQDISTYNFDEFNNKYNKFYPYLNLPDNNFLQWFIGYFEENGKFISNKPRVAGIPAGGGHNELNIIISSNKPNETRIPVFGGDKEILEYIINNLGFGKIVLESKKNNKYKIIIDKRRDQYLLILLLNGNMVFPVKFIKLTEFISKLNLKLIKNNEDIILIKYYCILPSLNNLWLLGLIDAQNSLKYNNSIIISQRYKSNKIILKYILDLLNKDICLNTNKSKIINISTKNGYKDIFEIRITGLNNYNKLLEYLSLRRISLLDKDRE